MIVVAVLVAAIVQQFQLIERVPSKELFQKLLIEESATSLAYKRYYRTTTKTTRPKREVFLNLYVGEYISLKRMTNAMCGLIISLQLIR